MLVSLLRVLPLERLPSLPDLFHHRVALAVLHQALDLRIRMPWSDDELVAMLEQISVGSRMQLDHLETACVVALAVEPPERLDVVHLGSGLDQFVDASKNLLVAGSPLSEVHPATVQNLFWLGDVWLSVKRLVSWKQNRKPLNRGTLLLWSLAAGMAISLALHALINAKPF